jgi:hypothetical protein
MTALTDAMAAVVAAIKSNESSIDPTHIAAIDQSIQSLTTQESTDAANITDIQNALGVLHDGLVAPAPAPSPAPAPDSAPDSTPAA